MGGGPGPAVLGKLLPGREETPAEGTCHSLLDYLGSFWEWSGIPGSPREGVS